ncbi:hypothetical protein RUM44_002615 [Polyplax serrata]|uniref:Uncharacterized protein n=1 Tax=Polyplax serrata TaxID=468196 RepID=A0ABR1AF85_POLSC
MNFYETAVISNKQTSPRKTAGSVGGSSNGPVLRGEGDVQGQGVVLSVKDRNHMDVAKGPERRQQTAAEDRREVERKGERQIRQAKCGEEGRGNQERRDGKKRRQLERF